MIRSIIIDPLDILFDFTTSVCVTSGASQYGLFKKECIESYEELPLTREEIFKKIGLEGKTWWAHLPPQPWARELWNWCEEKVAQTYLWSNSTLVESSGNLITGQSWWLSSFISKWPSGDSQLALGSDALVASLASPDHILVTANKYMERKFRETGGNTVLVPMPYNQQDESKFPLLVHEVFPGIKRDMVKIL